MKLKEYIENLDKLVKENPEALELEVVCPSENDYLGYQKVKGSISMGDFDDNCDFVLEEDYEADPEYYEHFEINAVCIN